MGYSEGIARICCGSVILVECLFWIFSYERHQLFYSIPITAIFQRSFNNTQASIFLINSSIYFFILLQLIILISSIFFIIGYKTKLSNFLLWIFISSQQVRFSVCTDGGDTLLKLFLFWGLFCDWDKKLSVDAAIVRVNSLKNSTPRISGFWGIFNLSNVSYYCMMLQLIIVHLAFVIHLRKASTFFDGTAISILQFCDFFPCFGGKPLISDTDLFFT